MWGTTPPFPWWLWVLAALWAGSLVLRRRLPPRSEWGWPLDVLIGGYTALLVYSCVRGASAHGTTEPTPFGQWLLFWVCAAAALAGALLWMTLQSPRWGIIAGVVCFLGIAGLAAQIGAHELAVLSLGVGGCLGWWGRGAETVDASAEVGDASNSEPRLEAWLVAGAATMIAVIWLGTVQYGYRVEAHRPGPSRWFTVVPQPAAIARWQNARQVEKPNDWQVADVSWPALLLGAAVVWLSIRPPLRDDAHPAPTDDLTLIDQERGKRGES